MEIRDMGNHGSIFELCYNGNTKSLLFCPHNRHRRSYHFCTCRCTCCSQDDPGPSSGDGESTSEPSQGRGDGSGATGSTGTGDVVSGTLPAVSSVTCGPASISEHSTSATPTAALSQLEVRSESPSAPRPSAAQPPPPPLTGVEEEAWQLKRLDMPAVQRMYAEVLSGEEPLVVAAVKRGGEHLLDTLGVRTERLYG